MQYYLEFDFTHPIYGRVGGEVEFDLQFSGFRIKLENIGPEHEQYDEIVSEISKNIKQFIANAVSDKLS